VPGFGMDGWTGLLGPADMSPELARKIAAAVNKALNQPATKKKLEAMGSPPGDMSPEEFGKFVDSELKRWQKFVAESGIKVE